MVIWKEQEGRKGKGGKGWWWVGGGDGDGGGWEKTRRGQHNDEKRMLGSLAFSDGSLISQWSFIQQPFDLSLSFLLLSSKVCILFESGLVNVFFFFFSFLIPRIKRLS